MWLALKRLSLGFLLILFCSAILLYSDWQQRKPRIDRQAKQQTVQYRIGLVYITPEEGTRDCIKALKQGLRDKGLHEGQNLEIREAHAQGEISNLPALLQNYDGQQLDAIVTMTTPCLTAACAIVKKTRVVFTLTYDPIAAGAGKNFQDHRPNMTGIGSFPPIQGTIQLMRTLLPHLKSVGVIYNSAEANSRKVMDVARNEFDRLAIVLEEATVNATTEVSQAADSLVSRRVQLLWAAGDNTVRQAFESLVKVSRNSKIPIVSNDMGTGKGQVVEVGLNTQQSCSAASVPLFQVLKGSDPAKIPIQNVAYMKTTVDLRAAKIHTIEVPSQILETAYQVIEPDGQIRVVKH